MCMTLTNGNFLGQRLIGYDFYDSKSKGFVGMSEKHNFQIETVTAKDILAFYEWALKYGRRNVPKSGDTSLSRRTVRDVAMIVKAFLNDAVVQGIIPLNPADKVSVPRVKKNNTEEIAYMELDEAKRFLAFVKSEELFKILYYISKLGFIYGMRRSELLGLRWSTFDFERMGFEVNHTVVRVSTTTEHRDNTKTESLHRYYPITNDAYDKCLTEKAFGDTESLFCCVIWRILSSCSTKVCGSIPFFNGNLICYGRGLHGRGGVDFQNF